MSNDPTTRISRRTVTAVGTGFTVGLLVTRGVHASASEATPGYVTMRMRPLDDPQFRGDMNARVIGEFLPKIAAVEGFEGYLVADVIDHPNLTFGVTVLRDRAAARSDAVAKSFVFEGDIDKHIIIEETRQWAGDLLMLCTPADATGDAVASPVAEHGAGYYVTARIHTSLPNTDPRGFVPEAIAGFPPIIVGLPGFVGYLWFPVEGGFVALSVYDTKGSAIESTNAAKVWATEHLAAYTDGNPEVINAIVVYADVPIFEA